MGTQQNIAIHKIGAFAPKIICFTLVLFSLYATKYESFFLKDFFLLNFFLEAF